MNKLSTILCTFLLFSNAVVFAAQAPWIGNTLKGEMCNGGGQGYGPYDYTQKAFIDERHLNIVEKVHFTHDVEMLIKGSTNTTPEHDINYTLRAWPNHHRALKSIMRYQLNINAKITKGKLKTPPECYFQRAIYFSPKDVTTLNMYAYFLKKSGHPGRAKKIYQKALEIAPKNRRIAYSYSFLLIDLKEYKEALKYAHLAYEKGKAPNKLKNKLQRLGVWKATDK